MTRLGAARVAVLAALAVALVPASVLAHAVGVSRGDYRLSGARVEIELAFARPELVGAVPSLDADRDGSVSAAELAAARSDLEQALVDRLVATTPAGACRGALSGVHLAEQDGIVLRALYSCPGVPASVSFRLGFLEDLSYGHRHLVAASAGPVSVRTVAYAGAAGFDLAGSGAAGFGSTVWSLFRMGTQHILGGYDHLVFLLGLILVGGRLRSLLVVVTAFTVAHSLTLGVAALGLWVPSPALVEPAIALSIAYVGIENWFVRDAGRRWLVTFPFGLVHGFGFAGALREIALPRTEVPLALVSFNAGVEAGQLGVLLLVLPAVLWLRRRAWFAEQGVRLASAAIALAGLAWFVARLA